MMKMRDTYLSHWHWIQSRFWGLKTACMKNGRDTIHSMNYLRKMTKVKRTRGIRKIGKERARLGREPKWYFQSQRSDEKSSLKKKSLLKRWWLEQGSCQVRTEKVVEFDRKEVLVSTNEQFPGSGTYTSQGSMREAKLVGYICCL